MVSKTSDDLPEPDTPVTTVSRLCGISSEMFLRLWTRAPRIRIESCTRYFQYSDRRAPAGKSIGRGLGAPGPGSTRGPPVISLADTRAPVDAPEK